MSEESLTLYKLMILFMLDNLDFPLTNSQLSEFFVNHGYTSYFHLQQAINELVESEFVRAETIRNTTINRRIKGCNRFICNMYKACNSRKIS